MNAETVEPISMADFDPEYLERAIDERMARTTNERHRQILETLRLHVRAERCADLEAMRSLLSTKRQWYRQFGGSGYPMPTSYDEAIAFYELMFASATNVFQYKTDHIAVDDDCVVAAGVMHVLYPGGIAAAAGHPVDDPSQVHLLSMRISVVFEFDEDGLSVGEHVYGGSNNVLTPIPDANLPVQYTNAVAARDAAMGDGNT